MFTFDLNKVVKPRFSNDQIKLDPIKRVYINMPPSSRKLVVDENTGLVKEERKYNNGI